MVTKPNETRKNERRLESPGVDGSKECNLKHFRLKCLGRKGDESQEKEIRGRTQGKRKKLETERKERGTWELGAIE
eukprot:scaffold632902_cov161-Attheya_sp.AAC.2